MKQSLRTFCVTRAVVGLVVVASAGRRFGLGLAGRSQRLDEWAQRCLVAYVRRQTERSMRTAAGIGARAAGSTEEPAA